MAKQRKPAPVMRTTVKAFKKALSEDPQFACRVTRAAIDSAKTGETVTVDTEKRTVRSRRKVSERPDSDDPREMLAGPLIDSEIEDEEDDTPGLGETP